MKIRLIWFQVFLLGLVVAAPFLGLGSAPNDLAVVVALAVMLVLLTYLGRPMETVSDMHKRILGIL